MGGRGAQRGQFDFTGADKLVAFARTHNQKVRGHTLVWHNQLPSWLTSGTWTRAQLRAILRQHIFTEVGHFRGRIAEWDVVNEATDDNGQLRDTFCLRNLGPSYIPDAFRWAHQGDRKAILIEGVGVEGHLSTRYGLPQNM